MENSARGRREPVRSRQLSPFHWLYSIDDEQGWEDLCERLFDDAVEVENLSERALASKASLADVVHAGRASVQLWNAIRFCMAAARGVDASTKALTLRLTDYD